MTREQKVSDALRRLLRAVEALGQRDPESRKLYFEEDTIKNAQAFVRWTELHDARMEAMSALAD